VYERQGKHILKGSLKVAGEIMIKTGKRPVKISGNPLIKKVKEGYIISL